MKVINMQIHKNSKNLIHVITVETEGEKGTSSGPQIPLTPPLLQFFPLALEKKETQLPPPLKGWWRHVTFCFSGWHSLAWCPREHWPHLWFFTGCLVLCLLVSPLKIPSPEMYLWGLPGTTHACPPWTLPCGSCRRRPPDPRAFPLSKHAAVSCCQGFTSQDSWCFPLTVRRMPNSRLCVTRLRWVGWYHSHKGILQWTPLKTFSC